MGLLDDLKKLTKPYDQADYLEEDLEEPVRVPFTNTSYTAQNQQVQSQAQSRRPYVFTGQPRVQTATNPYANRQAGYPQQNPYAQQQAYTQVQNYGQPQQNPYMQQQANPYMQPQNNPYMQQQQSPYGQTQQANPFAQAQPTGYAQAYQPQSPVVTGQPRLLLVKPDRFEVAADIADKFQEKNAVVLNLEDTDGAIARRLLDFLSGVTYALRGKIKKVSVSTYVLTPEGLDFMGEGLSSGSSAENNENT